MKEFNTETLSEIKKDYGIDLRVTVKSILAATLALKIANIRIKRLRFLCNVFGISTIVLAVLHIIR